MTQITILICILALASFVYVGWASNRVAKYETYRVLRWREGIDEIHYYQFYILILFKNITEEKFHEYTSELRKLQVHMRVSIILFCLLPGLLIIQDLVW